MSAVSTRSRVPSADPADAPLPTHIGDRYRVLEQLGRGGMAVVYRVRDSALDRELALKQLSFHSPERDRAARVQFEREFYLLAQLSHPSVIQVYDYAVEAQQPYYTMELLDGGDLSGRAPLSVSAACELMVQLCSSLSLLHSRRLVHRDITPRNVRCTLDGRAKLIDFGALLPMGLCWQSMGTPGFVAPEVVHHLAIDARTDLYSLGATLYYALTGKKPLAARSLADLNELWREPLVPPSQHAPQIPPALDALVLSLMQLDPARRPLSAFEVMQRLAAIGGIVHAEPEQIAQSYLFAPALVARDAEQRRFRQQLRRALDGTATCSFFEGESGSGRTRLLDVCSIESKLAGATVVRVNGRAASSTPLAAAHYIAEQIALQLPALALDTVRQAGVADVLLVAATSGVQSLQTLRRDRYRTQHALRAWLHALCKRRPLVLALDDIEQIDEASLGWLTSLIHEGRDRRLLILAGVEQRDAGPTSAAIQGLRSQAVTLPLVPLSAEQTEGLFGSIFFDAPHVALLSARIYRVALGNLRESMALAQHLLERRLIRYVEGAWSLPAELALTDLPASVEDAVRARVAALPELARELVCIQALAAEGPFARADYGVLAPEAEPQAVDTALLALVLQRVLVRDGATYALSDLRIRACLTAELDDEERAQRHRQLAELCLRSQRHTAIEVHHRLLAGDVDVGLDKLMALLSATPEIAGIYAAGVGRRRLAAIIELACALSSRGGRPAREAHDLRRRLIELSLTLDDGLYARHAPALQAQLELDSGWCDYQRLPSSLASSERLQQAFAQANARYQSKSEHDRVYRSDEAMKLLIHFAGVSPVIATRTRDRALFATISSLLEPFTAASPACDALFQMALAAADMHGAARLDRARERMLGSLRRFEKLTAADVSYVETRRLGAIAALAGIDVSLGYTTAIDWISTMEQHSFHRLGALYMKRMLYIFDADGAAAERCRSEAELLALQTDGRGGLRVRPVLQLTAHLHTSDLAGVRHAADLIEQLSHGAPGWIAMHHVAQGCFEHMRGNLTPARAAFERALAAADPDQLDPLPDLEAWLLAAAGYVTVLTDLGLAQDAHAFGTNALRINERLSLSGTAPLIRACALAQARLGDFHTAIDRLERLIAERASLRPAMLAPDYEARARIAIWQRDAAASAHFVALALEHRASLAVRSRLLDEAKQAGLTLPVNISAVEAALAHAEATRDPGATHAALQRFSGLTQPSARAQRALELFAQAANVSAGHLYYFQGKTLRWVAALDCPRDATLDRFAAAYVERQIERAAMTTVFTEPDDAPAGMGSFVSQQGVCYGLAAIGPDADTCMGLVALRDASKHARDAAFLLLAKAITQYLLELGDIQLE